MGQQGDDGQSDITQEKSELLKVLRCLSKHISSGPRFFNLFSLVETIKNGGRMDRWERETAPSFHVFWLKTVLTAIIMQSSPVVHSKSPSHFSADKISADPMCPKAEWAAGARSRP